MTARRPSILLVEDNPDDADVLRELLADAEARVDLHWAETLSAGLAALARHPVEIMLLDLSLPDSQGLDTVRRALAAAPQLPILVLTGLEDDGLGVAAVHAGAQDYLVKGQVDGAMLMRCMRYARERHRLLAARTADAAVWAALARGGAGLLETASGPGVPQALCTVAREALGCGSTSTWILDRAGTSFIPVAALPRREWYRVADHALPREALAPLAADGETVRWVTPALRRALPAGLTVGEETLVFAFAHGDELIAVQACGYAQRPPEDGVTMRIARGLVHVAGLALANARLVDALERSNSVKTYFAATMSHELRNTLFAISGFGDMLADQFADAPDGEPARLARAVGGRARDSLAMIQAALELTRSEVRPADDAGAPVLAAELLERLAAETRVPADKPELRVEWAVPAGLPPLHCDAIKLGMVLKNLVTNALKFTERGTVRVAVEPIADGLRFVVADTGIGIDAAELPHLFEPFHQAHGARSRRAGGAGLGCYIVARLVEMIGGQLAVESQPGVGTRFAVTVPLDGGG
ncbi:MAG: ATP-binding protein [Deltaproteobacteria bacterium]|nr:ATP-binding protein [Deltaproteobacteria bacterium]